MKKDLLINKQLITEDFAIYCGDSAEVLEGIPKDSIHLSVYSPPFLSLYTYSASERDVGNCKDEKEFFEHYSFIIKELLKITMPGRITLVHCAQVPAMNVRDGYIGLKDFRGKTIQAHEDLGWIFYGEVCIDKCPQVQAVRTKAKQLLFVQVHKDSAHSRPGLADYILIFRKPGENPIPITPDITNKDWISWARPVWYGIKETDTLNFREAREDKDERHLAPLQLGVIERCIRLWSNPTEIILSPFMGIGSEGYMAIKLGRKFVGIELKESYFNVAADNLKTISKRKTETLFGMRNK